MTDVLVLGAGMVGVSTALALQSLGANVLLADHNLPGTATSYGNAGVIQAEAVEPYAFPRRLSTLWKIANGRSSDVHWNIRGLVANATPLWSYFRHSTPSMHRAISSTYSALISLATQDHGILAKASNAEKLIARCGLYAALRSSHELDRHIAIAQRLHDQYGVLHRLLTGPELSAAEPQLRLGFAGAIHWTESWHCSDPGALVQAYANLFLARGGHFILADAKTLTRLNAGWQLKGADGFFYAQSVVLALGPWTPAFTRQMGMKFPMLGKKGYHRHFTGGGTLGAPLIDVERGAVYSPMRSGLRLLTGADISKGKDTSCSNQMHLAQIARTEVLGPAEPIEKTPWSGVRPCMPDMLPVLGQSPYDDSLWFNFGHGHQGFTLGPTTGRLLAGQLMENAPMIAALSPARFI